MKNNKRYMLISTLIVLAVSFYLYITQWDVYIHDEVLLWGKSSGAVRSVQDFWGIVSRLGQEWVQISICIALGVFYYRKCNYRMSRLHYGAIVVYLTSGIVIQILKFVISRPRPKRFPEYDPMWFETAARFHSWPSGHTATTFAWLACLLPFYPKKIQVFLVAAACLVGFSRVGIGAHYMSDVLSGAVLGYVVGALLRGKMKLGEKS